jgi:hypothetical protein
MSPYIVSIVQKSKRISFALKLRKYADRGFSARLDPDIGRER